MAFPGIRQLDQFLASRKSNRSATKRRHTTLRRQKRRAIVERLENRHLLAVVTPVLTGNDVVFNGDATNDLISFSVSTTGQLQHSRGGSFGFASNLDLDSVTPGDQTRLVSEITSFRYDDAGGNDRLFFGGANPFSFGDAGLYALAGQITVNANAEIDSTGGFIELIAQQRILLNAGSSLTTVDGGISLVGNPDGSAIGELVGLETLGASIRTSGQGHIELSGFGGNDPHEYQNHGILLGLGTTIESTKQSSPAGEISITGTGGDSLGSSHGVSIDGDDIVLRSAYGDIEIVGQGGLFSSGNGFNFDGVYIKSADLIESTGVGVDAATITIDGTGGDGSRTNDGVQLLGATTDITSVDGNIRIIGQGGGDGSSDSNYGVYANGLGSIRSTGTGADAATITFIGDGGNGTRSGSGLGLFGAATQVTSAYGDISFVGRGGADTGYLNYGGSVGFAISSTGIGLDAAKIDFDGTGGVNSSGTGISVTGSVTTTDGDITITGTGTNDGTRTGNTGASVSATIVANGTANITVDGTGAQGPGNNGTDIVSNADLTTTNGAILITGQAVGGSSGYDVYVAGIQGIESKGVSDGTNPSPATITITGTAGSGSSGSNSVYLNGSSKGITSVDGAISITGHAGIGSSGVSLYNVGAISSTGTSEQAATITIHGEGGTRNVGSPGVAIGSTNINSLVGDISITGTGGTADLGISTSTSVGVSLASVEIASLGTTENATGSPAAITIDGTGGVGSRQNYGTYIYQSAVLSVLGNIDIRGEGGSAGYSNSGVRLLSTELTSTGEGAQAATILVSSNSGVSSSVTLSTIDGDASFLGLNGSSSSASGTITSTGLGKLIFDGGDTFVGGDISSEFGDIVVRGSSVYQSSGLLQSTGTGSGAAKILIDDESTHSIRLNGDVSSVDGDIEIKNNITDASTGAGYVWIYGDITSTGTDGDHPGKITIEGTGADGQTGVYFRSTNQVVSSVVGDILITGRGGDSTGNGARGVFLSRSMTIESTGTNTEAAQIVIHGTGGAGVNSNTGVYFDGDNSGEISSIVGAISITGVGGAGTGRSNDGVYVRGASISSTGTTTGDPVHNAATITINGTGGGGTFDNDGVEINAPISSHDGAVLITGTGGVESIGVILNPASSLTSSGEGSDAATLTVEGTAGLGTNGSGVHLNRPTISSVDGVVSITGRGSEGRTIGLEIDSVTIESTGMGEHAATIDLIGIGGDGVSLNNGIEIDGLTSITSFDGDINIDGTGGNSTNSSGTFLRSFDTIASLGTSSDAAQIIINGSGLGLGSHGVILTPGGGQRLITSNYGDISITGQAPSIGVWGVYSETLGPWQIVSAGSGSDAANITIEGDSNSSGIGLGSGHITTIDGDISITGSGASGTSIDGAVSSTGVGSEAGNISILGTGASYNGSDIRGTVTTTDGDITITGSAGGDRQFNRGVTISGTVSSIGIGALAGRINITGTTAAEGADGVHLSDGSGIASIGVASVDGDIEITGTAAGGNLSSGVYIRRGVTSTGIDKAFAAQVTITGSGGPSGGSGVIMQFGNETDPNVSTAAGDVLITGTGGSGDGSGNRGVWLRSAHVESTGVAPGTSGSITIEGTGGSGTNDLIGVDLDNSESRLVSMAGEIEIIATAGIGSGTNNSGLRLTGSSVIGDANTTSNIVLRTDSIDLQTGAIQSTGTLTIEPTTASTTIGLGGGAGDLNLDDVELALLADGFESVTIGGATAGIIDIDTATLTDDVIISGTTINDHSGSDVNAGANAVKLVGIVSPGQSPGILSLTGAIELAVDSVLEIEIDGPAPGESATDHDQVNVVGTLTIGTGVELRTMTTNGFDPTLGQQLVIVENDGTDPIIGVFGGLPEGTILTGFLGAALDARISYLGLDEATGNDVVLTIIQGNRAPSSDAGGPYSIEEGDSLSLDASGSSDPDGDTLSYAWDLNGDGDFGDATGVMQTVTYAELAALGMGDVTQFEVTVSVDDGRANAVTDSATVNVLLNVPPTADAGGPYFVDEGGSVTLDASGTTDDKGIENLTIEWDFDGDGTFDATGLQPVFSAALVDGPQVLNVQVRVIDDRGKVDIDNTTISVRNVAPTITLDSPEPTITIERDAAFTLDGSFVDPGLDSWTATVNYADGSGEQPLDLVGNTFQLSHQYSTPGAYTVVVTIDDGDGGVTSKNLTVEVELPSLANLTLISADVIFEPINPAVGQSFEFVVDVTNEGSLAASNVPVVVQVYDENSLRPDKFEEIVRDEITSLGVGVKGEIRLTWNGLGNQRALPSEAAYLLIRVLVDPDSTIEELDESNNEAIQVLQIGSPDPSSAVLTADVPDFTAKQGERITVGGRAYYNFLTVPGDYDFPIQNASVTARLTNQTTGELLAVSGGRSAPNGGFSHTIRAPEDNGTYTLKFEISDGTLSKVFERILTVDGVATYVPPRPSGPGQPGYVFSTSVQFPEPPEGFENHQIGIPLTITGGFSYELEDELPNFDVTFNDLFPVAGQVRAFKIGEGLIGFPEGGLLGPAELDLTWTPTAEGYHIIQVIAEPDFSFRAHKQATRAILIGDFDTTSLSVAYATTKESDPEPALAPLMSASRGFAAAFAAPSMQAMATSDAPAPGDTLSYSLRYENTGTTTITGGFLIDDFDESLMGTPTNISDGGTADGNVVRWELGDIAPGTSGTVSYQVTINSAADFPPGAAFLFNTAILNADQAVAAGTSELTLSNNSPVITGLHVDEKLDENGDVTLSGTFSDASATDTHTVAIDWGDGQTATLTFAAGERAFSIPHSYGLSHSPLIESYAINVSVTDDTNQSASGSVNTAVPATDQTPPSSSVLDATAASSGTYDVVVDFADSSGPNEAPISGVTMVDVFYRVNPSSSASPTLLFGRVAVDPAAPNGNATLSAVLDASPGDIIQLWSVAADGAGNGESEITPRTDFSFVTADTVGPQTQVVSAVFDDSAFINLMVSGADVGGGNVDSIEVYVETDPSTSESSMTLIGTVAGGANAVSGTLQFAVPQDGVTRSYRFFSIGVDHLGNREGGSGTLDGDPGAGGDVLLADIMLAAPASGQIIGFDVGNGLENRSAIHSADVLFNDENFIEGLLASLNDGDTANDRIRIERLDLAGNPIGDGEFLPVSAVQDGLKLRLDFGAAGLLQNGIYAIRVDMDGDIDNGWEEQRRFHRLLGDINGDGLVDRADLGKVRQAYRNPALHADADVDGDGDVDRHDLRFFSTFLRQRDAEKALLMLRGELDD